MYDFKSRDHLYDQCPAFLKSGKPCQFRKLKSRAMCKRCLDKKKQAEDPTYRRIRQTKPNTKTGTCPACGGKMAYSSAVCNDCRYGNVVSWEIVAMLYSYRNPDDPITKDKAKRIGDTVMQKIREKARQPVEDSLSDALSSLKVMNEERNG